MITTVPTTFTKPGFAPALTDWYQASHRDLPWRNTRDPYAIWLSEIMLQQTQVKTVLDYYRRFLEKYPTVRSLAEAPSDDLLKQWEGLGYYARCRNLQKAAIVMVERHDGRFPKTLAEAEALPGVGKSTAGAILTFAYGQRHPLLDGNVKRVLSRVFDIEEDIGKGSVIQRMWGLSEALLAGSDSPELFNQAIMEIGATLCLPKAPQCLICPVQGFCDAFASGSQHERPVKAASRRSPHYTIAVGIIRREDRRILIQQRPSEGLLGGLWEFPGGKQEEDEALEETVRREINEELGIHVSVGEQIATVKHAYTHFKITLHAYVCDYLDGEPQPNAAQAVRWVLPDALGQYAFPKANKMVLERLLARHNAN